MLLNKKQLVGASLCGWVLLVNVQAAYGSGEKSQINTPETTAKTIKGNTKENSKYTQKKKAPWKAVLEEIAEFFRKKTHATSRGTFCAIVPGLMREEHNKIFSDRLLFIWKGEVDQIELENFNSTGVIWAESIPKGLQRWKYSGSNLIPGETYVWALKHKGIIQSRGFFEVMTPSERAHIIAQGLSVELDSTEDIAPFKQAHFFAKKKLWSDALLALDREVNTVKATAIDDFMNSWSNYFCGREWG